MKNIFILFIIVFYSLPLLAKEEGSFFKELLVKNLEVETQHLFVTNFTKNNTLNIFTYKNILHITEHKTTNENKIKIIKLITLIDKLIKKRKELFTLSSNLSTYHILQLTENRESDVPTKESLTELFELINNLDNNIISGLQNIKELYKEKEL